MFVALCVNGWQLGYGILHQTKLQHILNIKTNPFLEPRRLQTVNILATI